ncbi:MAG TPA: hypothetical protein VF432_21095 [Thermoanaerobaculia bacterium]
MLAIRLQCMLRLICNQDPTPPMRTHSFVLTLALLGSLAAAPATFACSCAETPLIEQIDDAPLIFTGKVVRLEVTGMDQGVNLITATVRIEEQFKGGPLDATVEFSTSDGCCYCAFGFDIGQTYLLFAYPTEEKDALHTSMCTPSKLLEDAEKELAAVRKAKAAGRFSPGHRHGTSP